MSAAAAPGRPGGSHAARPRRGLPGDALHAEWTKLRTLSGTGWLLAATAALTIAAGAAAAAATSCPRGTACPVDPVRLSLTGVQLGQAVVAVLAVLVITAEYSTGMIRTTLAAMPRRPAVLAAKAGLLAALVLAAGAAGVAGSLAAGRLMLPGHGFTPGRGFALVSLAHAAALRAAAGSVLYLALIALLSLGVATVIRDSAVAIGVVLGLLYLLPVAAAFLGGDPVWQRRVERYSPTLAGLTVQHTTGLRGLPIGPWAGLGVLACWAAAALLAGGLALRLRDA